MSETDPRSLFDNLPTTEQETIETNSLEEDQVTQSNEPPVWDGVWPAK